MGNLFTRNLRQDVTYWPTSDLQFGGFTFGTPVLTKGRWEERAELVRRPDGEEVTSRAVIHVMDDIDVGDYIALGDFSDISDPTTLTDAFRVMQFQKSPDLRGVLFHRKAFI